MDSLKTKTAKNLGIVYGARIITMSFGMIASIVLARLLTPADFGLVALSGIILAILLLFQDFGLGTALVQRQKDIDEAVNVVFYSTILIKFILYIIIFATAPFAADFFNEPVITEIIRISGLSLIIDAFAAGHSSLMLKNMEFKKLMSINVASGIFSSTVSVILALLGFSFWSLVYGSLAATPLSVILYWYASSWRPKFLFNIKVAKEMLGFGGWFTFSEIIVFFILKTDGFFIGKFLSLSSLGIYNMGMNFGLTVTNQLSQMSTVLFPTFSSIQKEKEKIRNAYLKVLKYTTLLTIPAALGIITIAPEFVVFILGEKWVEAILPIQIFSIYGLFQSISSLNAQMFLALGEVKLNSKIHVFHLIFILVFIYPLLLWQGIVGVALCVTLAYVVRVPIVLIILFPILDIKLSALINILKAPIVASTIMFLSIIITKILIGSSIYTLFIFILIGIAIYFSVLYVIDKEIFTEFKEILSAFKK